MQVTVGISLAGVVAAGGAVAVGIAGPEAEDLTSVIPGSPAAVDVSGTPGPDAPVADRQAADVKVNDHDAADSTAKRPKPDKGGPASLKRDPLDALIEGERTTLPDDGAGSAQRKGKAIGVSFSTTDTSAGTRALIEKYGTVRSVVAQPPTITAWVRPEQVAKIEKSPVVKRASLLTAPATSRVERSPKRAPGQAREAREKTAVASAADVNAGGEDASASANACNPLESEANVQLNAAVTSATRGLDGTGITIGVLSDSFNATDQAEPSPTTAAQDVASGALPGPGNPCGYSTPVEVISVAGVQQDYLGEDATNEGRAMLQLIHSIAPGAKLLYATAYNGMLSYADNIRALRAQGADIIVDDVYYFTEPFFQDGPIAVAVSQVTADGALYFSSAGNNNPMIGGQHVGSFEAPAYRPTTCPSLTYEGEPIDWSDPVSCMNFSTTGNDPTYGFTVDSHWEVGLGLQWSQPWGGVTDDLDLLIINSDNEVVAWSMEDSTEPCWGEFLWSCPAEFAWVGSWDASAPQPLRAVIVSSGADTPRLKLTWMQVAADSLTSVEYSSSTGGDIVGPTAFGHSASTDALSVAAIPYNSNTTPEAFSSPGPATLYWGPVTGLTPAGALATPQVLDRPDFAATDGDCTTFFYEETGLGSSCPYRFYGTSAASPNAAAVGALLLDANRDLNQEQVRALLRSTALPMSGGSPTWSGAGRLNAQAAVASAVSGAPTVPLNLVATADGARVELAWNAPSSSGSSVISGYRLQRSADNGESWFTVVPSAQNSLNTNAIDTTVEPGHTYTYRVLGINETIKGVPTSGVSVSVPDVPDAPQSVVAAQGGAGEINVDWTAGSDNGSAITSFTVTALPGGKSCVSSATSCTIAGLVNGTSYEVFVVATNAVGTSSSSASSLPVVPHGAHQKLNGKVVKKLHRKARADLPRRTTAGRHVTWTTSTPKVCRVVNKQAIGKRRGTCRVVARVPGNSMFDPLNTTRAIKVIRA